MAHSLRFSGTPLADFTFVAKKPSPARDLIGVVIETPKGSRNKYSFDREERVFRLKTVLPAGMSFPYDFGFVPDTKAEDGDPIDVLVLMDEPAFPGCQVECHPVGIIEGRQTEDGKTVRNDRVIAVEESSQAWSKVRRVADLGDDFLEQLEEFWVNYNKLNGKRYTVLRTRGPREAREQIRKTREVE